jgi:hypothetical protein
MRISLLIQIKMLYKMEEKIEKIVVVNLQTKLEDFGGTHCSVRLWNAMMNYFYDELFVEIYYYDPYHEDLKARKVLKEMPFSELSKISIKGWEIIRALPISEQSKIPLSVGEYNKARKFIREMPISELSKISVIKFSRIQNAGKGTIKELKELCLNSGITLQP